MVIKWRAFINAPKDKQVFPGLELLGWYTYAPVPSQLHVTLNEQFGPYNSNPLLLMLTPTPKGADGYVI